MEKSNYFSTLNIKKSKEVSKQRPKHKLSSKSETNSKIDNFYSLSPSKSTKTTLKSKKKENLTSDNGDDENNTGNCRNKSESNNEDNNLDDSAEFFTGFRKFGLQKVKKPGSCDKKTVGVGKKVEDSPSKNLKQKTVCFTEEDKYNTYRNKIGLSCYEFQDPPCIPKSSEVGYEINSKTDESKSENNTDNNIQTNDSVTKQCPLCFKFVEKHVSHMKSCAAKRSVSTEQLLAALRLQQKQNAERQSLGLPTVPDRIVPRKNTNRKGPLDSNLELALALSVSMQEQEEHKVLQEAEMLMEAGLEEEANIKRSTLEGFGFATSRPVIKTAIVKNKSTVTPVLLKRTREDRERIITEKVAIILVGEDDVYSSMLEAFPFQEPRVRSKNLNIYLDKEMTLWKKSAIVNNQSEVYYVQSLSEFVSPSRTDISAGLRHLSQLPGRMNTPRKDREDTYDDKGPKFPTPSSDIIKTPQPLTDLKCGPSCIKNVSSLKKTKKVNTETSNFGKKLSQDWHSFLGKKEMSDITVYCKDEVEVPAHKLVLFVRCQSVLEDVIKESDCNNSVREMLLWSESSRSTCLAFLEYVYCGFITRNFSLDSEELKELKFLAKKYNVNDLLSYLKTVNSNNVSPFQSVSRSLFNDDQNSCTLSVESSSLLKNKTVVEHKSVEDLNIFNMSTLIENDTNTDLKGVSRKSTQSRDMFFESDSESDELTQSGSTDNLDLLVRMFDGSQRSQKKSGKLNSESFQENNPLSLLDSEFNNEKIQKELPSCSLVFNSDTIENINFESPKSVKSDGDEDFEVKSQKVYIDSKQINTRVDSSVLNADFDYSDKNQMLDSNDSYNCFSDDKLGEETFSDQGKQFSSNSSSTNLSENVNTDCSEKFKNNSQRLSLNSIDLSKEITFNASLPLIHSQSILRNSLNESKRKRTEDEISGNEDNLSSKKMCINNSSLCSQENKTETDVFDLTQSSENSSDKVVILSGESQDLNMKDVDPCRLTPKKQSDETELTRIENNESSVYIDPVWDGFDEMNFNDYNYVSPVNYNTPEKCDPVKCTTPVDILDEDTLSPTIFNSKLVKINSNTPEKCDPVKCTTPVDILDEDTLSPTSFNSKFVTKFTIETVCDKFSEEVSPGNNICSSDFNLNLQNSSDINYSSNNSLSPQFLSGTKNNSHLNSHVQKRTSVKCPILDLSKLSPTSPEHIVIIDSDCDSPKSSGLKKKLTNLISKPVLSRDSLSSVKRLLDDSLEISDSMFSENMKETQSEVRITSNSSGTSRNASCITPPPGECTTNNVTPLPDYSAMKTPALKRELSKYGLKPSLGRKKGKLMLRYIYNQLHPLMPQSPDQSVVTGSKGCVFKSPDKATVVPKSPCKKIIKERYNEDSSCSESDELASQSSSCSTSSSCAILEESILADSLEDEVSETLSQRKCVKLTSADIPPAVKSLIYNDPELHQKILMYEPIFIEELIERLKLNGFKCKKTELMDYLDEQCMTFRSLQGVQNRQKAQLRRETRKKYLLKQSQAH